MTADGSAAPVVGRGMLRLEDFQRIVDENRFVKRIELSNFGEIFLNPVLPAMMEHAHKKGVELTADNGVNLNAASDEMLDALVRLGFRSLSVSLDGASRQTYAQYRVGGDFWRAISNIRAINRLKALYKSDYPRLGWQFIVFGHNEHEIAEARRMAAALGMAFKAKLPWDSRLSPVKDRDAVKRETGLDALSREEFRAVHGVEYMQWMCRHLWENPQVNWDGKVLGCCNNYWGDFGANAFEEGLVAAVNSEKMRYAREMLAGRAPARDGMPCSTCDMYLSRKARANWLDPAAHPRLRALRKAFTGLHRAAAAIGV
jgi:hypothetical protein